MSSLSLFFSFSLPNERDKKTRRESSKEELFLFFFAKHDAGQHRPPPGLWPPRQHRRQQWKPPQRRPRRRGGLDPVLEQLDHETIVVCISLPFDRQHGHPESPRRQDPGAAGENAREGVVLGAQRDRQRERELAEKNKEPKASAPFLSLSCRRRSPYQTRSSTPVFVGD